MTTTTYRLEVNWNNDGSTWTDEIANLLSCEWRRGRDYASQLTGHATAGQLVAELQNPAGRYAPLNSAGALYGNLLPGRKVRLRAAGCALKFDGTNDFVSITHAAGGYAYADTFYVAVWVNVTPNGVDHFIIGNGTGFTDNDGWHLRITAANTARFIGFNSVGSQYSGRDSSVISAGTHRIIAVWKAGATPDMYVDGALDNQGALTGAGLASITNTVVLSIGASVTVGHELPFAGTIDQVQTGLTAPSAGQVTADYAAGAGSPTNALPTTQGWWKFDEGLGTSAADSSGNVYTGTLTSFNFDATDGWVTGLAAGPILWQGFLSEIAPDPGSRDSIPAARIRAVGPLGYLADKKASTAVFTSILSGTAITKILDDAGWPVADRTLDAGQITMSRWKADGDLALNHIREIEETEIAYVGETKDGKIVFEDQQHRLSPPFTVSQATFSDASGASLPYEAIAEMDPWREVFNIFSADVTTYAVQTLAVLWTMTGETPSIGAGATKEFWSIYPTSDQPAQADHVDAWTTTTATTDMLANTQADGLGVNKTGAITVVCTKFANSMKIALTNTDAGTVFITFLQARGTGVYRNDPIRVLVEDATSQTKFGKRSYPLPGKFYPTTVVAKSYVDLGLGRYKDQLAIVALTYQANLSDAHMAQALARNISDRISLVAQGTLASGAQLGINYDFFIESERHSLSNAGHWVTYELSDARFDAGYWLLGTSQLGSTTKLAA